MAIVWKGERGEKVKLISQFVKQILYLLFDVKQTNKQKINLQEAPPVTFKFIKASSNPFRLDTKKNSSPESSFLTLSILNVER